MVPIYLARILWGKDWQRKRLMFVTDNVALAYSWQKFSSRHNGVMDMILRIYFVAALNNTAIKIQHLPGVKNKSADALSRLRNIVKILARPYWSVNKSSTCL